MSFFGLFFHCFAWKLATLGGGQVASGAVRSVGAPEQHDGEAAAQHGEVKRCGY